ncbi:SDR family NAD(P)-dependent oxidoreductase [Actinomadura miaoliensis]|uniref:Type I polyketide synthase n=1 Tax=Actinomadura miaoliensis TaxID=430685 RepID=A0ABP7WAB2_9ACTN
MSGTSDAIAVVGAGCRYPDAPSPDGLWELALSRRRAFRPLPRTRLDLADHGRGDREAPDLTYVRRAAVLDGWSFDRARHRVPGATFAVTDPTQWLALDVAARTLAAAGFPEARGLDADRAGVILGNSMGGEFSRAAVMRLRWPYVRRVLGETLTSLGVTGPDLDAALCRAERRYKEPFAEPTDESLVGGLANAIAGRVCNHFGLRGGGFTVDAACASSLLAVTSACTALTAGDLDFVLAGGVDLSLDPFELVGFARTGALATSAMRVYDASPTGFLPGEGCGMVALMRAADARDAGLTPLTLIRGWGVSSDGRGGLTRPERDGQLLAMRRAYDRAGFGPDTVALFEGHGTGTEVGDRAELGALIEVHAGARRRAPAALGSIKANIGHTKAAAGAAGLIKAAMALRRQVIPPTTGCREPHELLRDPRTPVQVTSEAAPWPDAPLRAAVSAMGFGGVNTHVVLEGAAPRRARRLTPVERRVARPGLDAEVFAYAADTRDALAAALERTVVRAATMSRAEHTDLAASLAASSRADAPWRAAIVARDPEQLARRAERARRLLDEPPHGALDGGWAEQRGVFLGHGAPSRVGLLFPGQGAPVRASAGAFGTVFPDAADEFGDAAADAVDTAVAQPAVFGASVAGLRWLARLGVEAAAAAGHSLGEITALCWAGALAEPDARELVRVRGRLMAEHGTPGTGMAAIGAPPDAVAGLIEGTGLCVAADNGPAQVVAGALPELTRVLELARAAGIAARRLPVSHAFHTAAVAAAVPELTRHLARTPIAAPRHRVHSTVTGDVLTAADDLREVLARQVTEPVRLRAAVEGLAAECDLLVECGPGHALAGLAAEIGGLPVVALDTGAESAGPLCRAVAALFAAGAVSDLPGALFAERFHRPFDLWREPEFLGSPCERGGAPRQPLAPPTPTTPAAAEAVPDDGVASTVRALVADALELPADTIGDADTLLGDLHLNSLRVAQLAARAAERCGRAVPAAPPSLADSTVGGLIEVIAALPPALGAEPASGGVPAGVAEWHRLLVEEPHPIEPPRERRRHAWRVFGDGPLRHAVEPLLDTDGDAAAAIAAFLPEDPGDAAVAALLDAARLAVRSGTPLTVVDRGDTASGFVGALACEHPRLDIRWIRVLAGDGAAGAIADVLAVPWRGHAELVVDGDDRPCVLTPRPMRPAAAGIALDARDVLLVTGGGKGIGLESAAHLAASYGVRLGLLGRADPGTDDELRAGLARLRAAGTTFHYAAADVTDEAALRTAVKEITTRLGTVTGLLHAGGVNRPARFTDLDDAAFAGHSAPKERGLRMLLDELDTSALRLLITFGSVIGRFGLAGEAHYALANGRMRELARVTAVRLPGCRVCNVDWTVWSGAGMGERLDVLDGLIRGGVTPLPAESGVRLLTRLVEGAPESSTVLATGRLPQLDAGRAPVGEHRFLRRVLACTPGVELVAEAELSLDDDPYLADHRLDGTAVLPAVCALEAMAQAAAVLTGPPRGAGTGVAVRDGRFDRPVTVPDDGGARTVRVCALVHDDGTVRVALRSDETDFAVDHFTGVVAPAAEPPGLPDEAPGRAPVPPHDGRALYGPLFFHGPRYQRLRRYERLSDKGCTAILTGAGPAGSPFGPAQPADVRLGDPFRNDASIHVLQACVPHRRLLPVGCDAFTVHHDAPAPGDLLLTASERSHTGAEYTYDVVLRDGDGRPVVSWTGLRLRDVGPQPGPHRLGRVLLEPYLQRNLDALLPDAHVRLTMALSDGPDGATGRGPSARHADGPCRSRLGDVLLTVSGAAPTACDCAWEADADDLDRLRGLAPWPDQAAHLRGMTGEPETRVLTRLWTVRECLAKDGRDPGGPLTVDGVYEHGWVRLRAGTGSVISAVVSVEGLPRPIALAVLAREER